MEQTFADNLRERRAQGGHVIAFLASTFAETSIGIVKERARRPATLTAVAALAGLLIMLPFMILEWTTSSDLPRSQFAFPLFVFLWLLAAAFIRMSVGVLRTAMAIRGQQVAVLRSVSVVARVAVLALIAWTWVSWIVDQWPCFLGATGC